ncbi:MULTISPECIES: ergothioneine biosynthesis glutamate--cysteine ligase EgtA [Thermomonosporaceae]|uniref:ergothioneine biosynthesis glutamate--cysteine ligase EgtA n=1 Tax=Thermomonosporaceae TaxID=2012 RepID=UPI00255AC75E|nr:MULTISPECIES: ergothioneine biosynthesis glutamate--cysteine ligase EgtA [Thermomonosporaceae]MDL4771831.1 ergothioneine biosynthesis glutamate--cysteine ligase EgtA [Actinomadura xylanilytica]
MTRLTIDDVYQHIHGVCFKNGPPGTVGAETEWFVIDSADPGAHVPGERVRALVDAAGPPPGGSRVTYEPGGQLELSSAPYPGLAPAHAALAADLAHLRAVLAPAGVALAGHGVDPLRRPVFQAEHPRYLCMRDYFAAGGFADVGRAMMCSTASVQVCLDIGADPADAARRWRLAHALGPVLVAAFANSPVLSGRRTGLRSSRQGIWTDLDPGRTGPVLRDGPDGPADPAEEWTRYALDAQVMVVHTAAGAWVAAPGMSFREWLGKGEPDQQDLEYHLSTLFPPVRPRGWLELRMIDALPDPYWPVPVAVATALLDDPRASALAEAAAEPAAGRWDEAARRGLADPVLGTAARACFRAALEALPRLGAHGLAPLVDQYARRYVERGRSPADDVLAPVSRSAEEESPWPTP